jgi:hypothetical protein
MAQDRFEAVPHLLTPTGQKATLDLYCDRVPCRACLMSGGDFNGRR